MKPHALLLALALAMTAPTHAADTPTPPDVAKKPHFVRAPFGAERQDEPPQGGPPHPAVDRRWRGRGRAWPPRLPRARRHGLDHLGELPLRRHPHLGRRLTNPSRSEREPQVPASALAAKACIALVRFFVSVPLASFTTGPSSPDGSRCIE